MSTCRAGLFLALMYAIQVTGPAHAGEAPTPTAEKREADEKPANEKPADAKPADEKPAEPEAASSDLGPVLNKAIRIAVYPLKVREVPERIGEVATNSLLGELRKLDRVAAIGMDEVKDMLTHEENKRLLGCGDESCLAEIAGAMGVDELVTGSLAKLGEASVINLRRLDLRKAESAGSYNQRLEIGEGEEFLAALGPAVEALYPGFPLRPGSERGVAEEVGLMLNPPPLPRWIFLATASTAAGLGLLGGGAAAMAKNRYDVYNHTLRDTQNGSSSNIQGTLQGMRDDAESWDQAKLGLLITALLLAAGAGLEAIWTDWWGYNNTDFGVTIAPVVRGGGRAGGAAVSGGVFSW